MHTAVVFQITNITLLGEKHLNILQASHFGHDDVREVGKEGPPIQERNEKGWHVSGTRKKRTREEKGIHIICALRDACR